MVLGTTYEGTRANGRRPEELPLRDAEGVGRLEEHHIFICEGVAPLEPGYSTYQAAVLDHDALGFSGRAGRVEDVTQIVWFWSRRFVVRQHPFERPRCAHGGVGRNDPFRWTEGLKNVELDDVDQLPRPLEIAEERRKDARPEPRLRHARFT